MLPARCPQSRKLVRLLQERTDDNRRPSFDAILNVYVEVFEPDGGLVKRVRSAWRYRSWIAHGKAWGFPYEDRLLPDEVLVAVDGALDMFWDFPKDLAERTSRG